MKTMFMVLVCLILVSGTAVRGEELLVQSFPASVVKTVPECGRQDVDATTMTQIKVTFSKDMMDQSWSWVQISNESYPKTVGKPMYLDDKRTCVLNVLLEPKKTYVIWLNSEQFGNFRDAGGNSAVPYLLVFQTK